MTLALSIWHYAGGIFLLVAVAAIFATMFIPQFKGARTKVLHWWGTIFLGGVLPMLAEMTGYLNTLDWREYVPAEAAPLVILAIGLLSIFLRRVMDSPPKTVTQATKDTVKVVVKSTTK